MKVGAHRAVHAQPAAEGGAAHTVSQQAMHANANDADATFKPGCDVESRQKRCR